MQQRGKTVQHRLLALQWSARHLTPSLAKADHVTVWCRGLWSEVPHLRTASRHCATIPVDNCRRARSPHANPSLHDNREWATIDDLCPNPRSCQLRFGIGSPAALGHWYQQSPSEQAAACQGPVESSPVLCSGAAVVALAIVFTETTKQPLQLTTPPHTHTPHDRTCHAPTHAAAERKAHLCATLLPVIIPPVNHASLPSPFATRAFLVDGHALFLRTLQSLASALHHGRSRLSLQK